MISLLSAVVAGAAIACSSLRGVDEVGSHQTETSINALAAESVCAAVADSFEQTEVLLMSSTIPNVYRSGVTPDEAVEFHVGKMRAGRVPVTVVKRIDGASVEGVLWYRVHGYALVWTAREDLLRENAVTDEIVRRERVDLAAIDLTRSDVVANPEGLVAKVNVRRGAPLTEKVLDEAPLVSRNEHVSVSLRYRNIRVRVGGVARTSGWKVGDEVKVDIPGAVTAVSATVLGKGEVHVQT